MANKKSIHITLTKLPDENGAVVLLDDLTELVSVQRMAAWQEVARRIAHEIKNPLTPIQLSAERLLRKYSKEIKTDPEVFENCTQTIIRQVGSLEQMVNEFSAFARMPAPNFESTDMRKLIEDVLFAQGVAFPEIEFELIDDCLLYTSPSPRDKRQSRMPSSA